MSDPYARALAAIDYLFAPDLGPVIRSALDEVRDAVLEAQALHAAVLDELHVLWTTRVPGRVTVATLDSSASPISGEATLDENEADLLAALDLLPDEPLPIPVK